MVGSNDRGSPKGSSKGALSTPSSSALGSNGTSAKGLSTETPKLADSAGASSRVEQRLSVLAAKLAQLKVCTLRSSEQHPQKTALRLFTVHFFKEVMWYAAQSVKRRQWPPVSQIKFSFLQDGAAAPELDAAMRELQDEVAHLKSVEEEITGYAERALAETERLTKENEELRKAQEDAALDRWPTQPVSYCPGNISAADLKRGGILKQVQCCPSCFCGDVVSFFCSWAGFHFQGC